jgi:hypothetical protein
MQRVNFVTLETAAIQFLENEGKKLISPEKKDEFNALVKKVKASFAARPLELMKYNKDKNELADYVAKLRKASPLPSPKETKASPLPSLKETKTFFPTSAQAQVSVATPQTTLTYKTSSRVPDDFLQLESVLDLNRKILRDRLSGIEEDSSRRFRKK